MAYTPMLPSMDETANALLNDQAGIWRQEMRTDFLNRLANSLSVSETLQDVGSIDSIPDIWSKPLLFKMALFAADDTKDFAQGLHERIKNEWRALLAMLALKNFKQINLRAESINLNEDKTSLARILKALAPKESINGDNNAWLTDIYIIYFNGKPIAMTSPTTLIAAAADYETTFAGQLAEPWSVDHKTLTDPINLLPISELAALKIWLEYLFKSVQDVNSSTQEATELRVNLLNCIKEYHQDVQNALGVSTDENYELTESNLKLHIGTARLLDTTIKGKEASVEDSAVKLITNPNRSNKSLLLISPQMVRDFARQEGIDPARLVIWQGVNANDINDAALSGERNKIGQISLNDTEFRKPEDFFYERMAVIEPGNTFPNSLEIDGINILSDSGLTAILPIKRELLNYFTPEEIADNLSISGDNDNIYLNYKFTLSGTGHGNAVYQYIKTYPIRELIYIQQEVPVIEIYPNIQREGWNKYYLYYENYQAQNEQSTELGNDIYYVEPYTYNKDIGKDFKQHGGKLNRYTAKLNAFPEALICTYKTPNVHENMFQVGLILMKKPQLTRRERGLNWKIGVDFGTSSTMLYVREVNRNSRPLKLNPHLLHITESFGARAQMYINFIPSDIPSQSDGSFLSIFHWFNNDNSKLRPLQDGHVFMLRSENTGVFNRLSNRIEANLKWKDDADGRRKVAAYVDQICLQALVEAALNGVDEIEWNFSYPTAFSQEQKLAFENTCRESIKSAYENTGFAYKDNETVQTWSESKASAYYFNKFNNSAANLTEGAICIDIGAGTTDVSIISGQPGRIIYHTSIQYAGRYMFKPIYDNYDLFTSMSGLKDIKETEHIQAAIDADMREHSEEYIKDLNFKTGQEDIKSVLQGSQFAVAGLFYYLGKLIGVLHERKLYLEDKLPEVFVGGNGSRIFNWLTGGTNISDNPFLSVMENMIKTASNLQGYNKFHFTMSHQPKVEVASGMIVDKPQNDAVFFDEDDIKLTMFGKNADNYIANSLLAGAEFKKTSELAGHTNHQSSEFISVYDIHDGININSVDEFIKFIKIFNQSQKLWLEGIPFDDEAANYLIRQANSFYVSEKGKDVKRIFLEPIFIVELKQFMSILNYVSD